LLPPPPPHPTLFPYTTLFRSDSNPLRNQLRERGIEPEIASRYLGHGSGLGHARWVVERTFAWLHHLKRLLARYDRRHEIHEAFLDRKSTRLNSSHVSISYAVF